MIDTWEVGQLVRDKFRQPPAGGPSLVGRIEEINHALVYVRMEDDVLRTLPRATFSALFVRMEDD